ncbi:MAG: AEC family transporter [Prevotella sp.]|nr:AEC family transporter [Prevotella sp.]
MENLEVMVSLVVIVIIGFVAGKIGYMNEEFDKKLSALIVNITCPALILSSTMGDTLPDRHMIVPLLIISFITYTILAVMSFTLPKLLTGKKDDEGVIGFALMFGNVGFIGYPIVASIFGYEAVFYAAILNVANTFYVFTIGDMLIKNVNLNINANGGGLTNIFKTRRFEKKVLYSTPMIAAYLSMLIVALGITGIPTAVSKPLSMIGGITVPGALLIIGSTMSQLSGRAMLGNVTVYATSVCRLVLIPFAFYWLFTMMGFSEYVVSVNTVIIAMPVATYGTILCLINNRDTTLMTELTFTTTILSMITIPLLSAALA